MNKPYNEPPFRVINQNSQDIITTSNELSNAKSAWDTDSTTPIFGI